MDFLKNLTPDMVWESIKTPIRQILLALYSLLLNKAFVYVSTVLGFNFTEDQKLQLLAYGVPVVWAIISAIDKMVHKLGKKSGNLRMTYGFTPYLEVINRK